MTLINNRNGQQLAVYTFGDTAHPALIFSNSLGTDYGMWQAQVAAFAEDYFVICYDTRGHGKSAVIENITLSDLANDVIDILDHFKVEKAHFCGISMGGITGLQLGLIAPQRFLSITIANSARLDKLKHGYHVPMRSKNRDWPILSAQHTPGGSATNLIISTIALHSRPFKVCR